MKAGFFILLGLIPLASAMSANTDGCKCPECPNTGRAKRSVEYGGGSDYNSGGGSSYGEDSYGDKGGSSDPYSDGHGPSSKKYSQGYKMPGSYWFDVGAPNPWLMKRNPGYQVVSSWRQNFDRHSLPMYEYYQPQQTYGSPYGSPYGGGYGGYPVMPAYGPIYHH